MSVASRYPLILKSAGLAICQTQPHYDDSKKVKQTVVAMTHRIFSRIIVLFAVLAQPVIAQQGLEPILPIDGCH